jgi:hypothetical protein
LATSGDFFMATDTHKPHLQWLTDDVKSGAKRLSRRVLSVALAILPINRA